MSLPAAIHPLPFTWPYAPVFWLVIYWVFIPEYRLTLRVLRGHDLYEGVRAILIDRDQRPRWTPESLAGVADEEIARYFEPLGENELSL